METTTNLWEVLLREFSVKSQQPEYIIECLSIYPIVKMAAEGYANFRISKRLSLPYRYVEETLIDFLDTTGWESDLDFSPLALYHRCAGVYDEYVRQVNQVSASERSGSVMTLSFNMCALFDRIQKELDRYGRGRED